MAKPGRPTKKQSEDLTARLIAVATVLFLEKGYAGTTIDELAMRLGAAKRTVYSRFADKADLFRMVTTNYAENALGQMPPVVVDERELAEQLHGACRDILGMVLAPDVIRIERMVMAEAERFPEIAPVFEAARLRTMERFHPILRRLDPGLTDEAVRERAKMLCDLVIAPPVRATALNLWPHQTAAALDQFISRRIALFLPAHSAVSRRTNGLVKRRTPAISRRAPQWHA